MMLNSDDRSEIAFFDVETTVPTRSGQGFSILEFGAILVCPRKLVELRSYSTLVRPSDLSHITSLSVRCNGITKDAVVSAPTFADISDMVYDLLHGRIWAGHNILRFDCARIREAFAAIYRPVPEPRGTIDSLTLLTQKFGRRAGDMKMATLATYFGLGQQTHRSLDDVRMNLEVLKYCATVLFLESSLPNTSEQNSPLIESNPATTDIFNMAALSEEIENEPLPDDSMEEEKTDSSSQDYSTSVGVEDHNDFLEADDALIPSISVTLAPFFRGTQKIHILHQNLPLQLRCGGLKVRFGISAKFVDQAGRPRLSFVVNPSPSLCVVLETTDSVAQKVSVDCGSSSEWRPVVNRKPGFLNFPSIRLHLPTVTDGEITRLGTEIYQKDGSAIHRLSFSRFDVAELQSIFTPGNLVDTFFSLDTYDFQQNAGIRLVAKKLILHST